MSNTASFFRLVNSPLKFRLFLLSKLPAAFFSGVKVKEAGEEKCVATVPFKWFSQNPFKSTYFACLSMAAELTTGVLAMAHIYKRDPAVSMLVIKTEGEFMKKAAGVTRFTCNDGLRIREAVEKAIRSGESTSITAISEGVNENGELVARFSITWGFRVKNNTRA